MSIDPICYLDGYARLSKLRIAPNDLGVLRAYGVFDFMRTFNGKPFMFDEHAARFLRSAKHLGLTVPFTKKELAHITDELIRRNGFKETAIKFVITGGPSADGLTLMSKPTTYILATPIEHPPKAYYTRGVHIKTYEYQRPLPEIKTVNYAVSVQQQKALKRAGILELLYVSNGAVLECSSSNIFLVKKNVLITPKGNILEGTTKACVMKLAKGTYRVHERRVKVSELRTADEIFVTASNKGVMPVTTLNGKKVGTGKVGPVAKHLEQLFKEKVGIV